MLDKNPKMSLEAFNSMISKAVAGDYKWQRKDGSWWTNHQGQIVPYHEPTHGAREIHPSPHEIDPEVAKPDTPEEWPAGEVKVQDKPVNELTYEEAIVRYNEHSEVLSVESMDGLDNLRKAKMRLKIRDSVMIEDIVAAISEGGKLHEDLAKRPFIAEALRAHKDQGELIDSRSIRQILRDEAFKTHAPRGKLLDETISTWPQQLVTSSPRGGWRPLKEHTKNKMEKAMDTNNVPEEDLDDTEEGFIRRMRKKLTPEFIVDSCVKRLKAYNEEAMRAEAEMDKRKLPNDFAKGKTREELKELMGEEFFNLMDSVAKHTKARRNLNAKAQAIMDRVPGASWF